MERSQIESIMNYYTVLEKIDEKVEELRESLDNDRWDAMKEPIHVFMARMRAIVSRIIYDPDYVEEGYNEIRQYADGNVVETELYGLPSKTVICMYQILAECVMTLLPDVSNSDVMKTVRTPIDVSKNGIRKKNTYNLADQVRRYMRIHQKPLKNVTRRKLMTILHKWYDTYSGDESIDIELVYNGMSDFIVDVHREIDSILKSSNHISEIRSYMNNYNEAIVNALTNLDVEEGDELRGLNRPLLMLLIEMRWKNSPRESRKTITYELDGIRFSDDDICDAMNYSGIDLDDLVHNFTSTSIESQIRESLDSILDTYKK